MNILGRRSWILLGSLAFFAACSSSTATQPVSGRLALDTFPATVTSVRAVRPDGTTVTSAVGADGSFSLALPAGRKYRLEFLTASSDTPRLVFPRQAGMTDLTFDVGAGGQAFDMGIVRYIGNPRTVAVKFVTSGVSTVVAKLSTDADSGAGDKEENDDGGKDNECRHGKDPAGAVCVDDDEDHGGKHQCHGTHGSAGQDDDSDQPATAAVADKNLPAVIGDCGERGDHHEHKGGKGGKDDDQDKAGEHHGRDDGGVRGKGTEKEDDDDHVG